MTTRGDRIADRYRIEAPLGTGSGGSVFAAFDEQTGQRVAVKLLAPSTSRGFDVERGVLRSVRHPHLLSVLDAGADAQRHFLVTELMDGGDLVRLTKPLDATSLNSLTTQLLEALAYLHAQGILHGDVKTENVFVQSLDPLHVRLGDFGLARLHSAAGGAVQGSPAFMPPEVIRGEPSDERSDLYSLGCVLYECAFGQPPFTDADVRQVLLRHLNETPARLSDAGDVDVRLVRLLRRLLAKEPATRPMDARAALAAWNGEEAAVPRWVPPRLGVLIGRESELASLEHALADPQIAAMTVEGPAGIGKTRLLREFSLAAELQGTRTLWLTAADWSLLKIESLPTDDGRSLAAARAEALKKHLGIGSWVLFVDDFDSFPTPLLDAFAYFIRDVASDPTAGMLIVAASRGEAHERIQEALAAGGFSAQPQMSLQAWSREQSEIAASALLGARRLQPGLVELIHSASGGVPAEIEAASRRLVEGGLLRTDAQGALAATAIVRIESIVEARSERLDRLLSRCTEEQMDLLQFMTILRTSATHGFLGSLGFDTVKLMPPLQRLGLTTIRRSSDGIDRCAIAHAGVRERIQESLDPVVRRRIHDRIAAQLEADPDSLAGEDARVHRIHGTESSRARTAWAAISTDPDFASQPEQMRECLETLLADWSHDDEPEGRTRAVISLGEIYIKLVDAKALDDLITLEESRLDREALNRMRVLRARMHLQMARPQLALDEIAPVIPADGDALSELECDALVVRIEALGLLAHHDRALADCARLRPHAGLGSLLFERLLEPLIYNLCEAGNLDEAEKILMQVVTPANSIVSEQCLAAAIGRLGHVSFKRGNMQSAFKYFSEAYSRCERLGDRFGMIRTLNGLGVIGCELGRFTDARECFHRALDFSRRLGEASEIAVYLNNLAQLLSTLGLYREALNLNNEARNQAVNLKLWSSLQAIEITRAEVLLALGLDDSSRQVLRDLLSTRPPEFYEGQATLLLAEIEMRRNNHPAALEMLLASEALFKSSCVEDELATLNVLMARVEWVLNNHAQAIARLREALAFAVSKHLVLTSARCNGYLAEFLAEINAPEALGHAESGLLAARTMQLPELQWRCERALGRIAFLQGDLVGALQMYRRCIDILREIGADMPAEMADSYFAVSDRRRVFEEIQVIRSESLRT